MGARTKYRNVRCAWGEEVFDSKAEMYDYLGLLEREQQGKLTNLRRQVPFVLQEAFRDATGKSQRAITYVADFVYEQEGRTVVWETKGVATAAFRLKWRMLLHRYPEIRFVLSKR